MKQLQSKHTWGMARYVCIKKSCSNNLRTLQRQPCLTLEIHRDALALLVFILRVDKAFGNIWFAKRFDSSLQCKS